MNETTTARITEDLQNQLNNRSVDLLESSPISINNSGNIYLNIFMYLIVIAVIIAGLFLLRRFLLKRLGNIKNGSYMRILDRLILSQDKQIIMIELKNKVIIAGITNQRIDNLSEFAKDELDMLDENGKETAGNFSGSKFINVLNKKFNPNGINDDENKK